MTLIFYQVKTLITMRSTTIFVYSFFLKKMKTAMVVLLITNNSNNKNNSNNNTKMIPLPTAVDRYSYT